MFTAVKAKKQETINRFSAFFASVFARGSRPQHWYKNYPDSSAFWKHSSIASRKGGSCIGKIFFFFVEGSKKAVEPPDVLLAKSEQCCGFHSLYWQRKFEGSATNRPLQAGWYESPGNVGIFQSKILLQYQNSLFAHFSPVGILLGSAFP